MKPPENTTQVLKAEAKKLTDKIFRRLPCVICYKKSGKQVFWNVEKHHLIPKGQSLKFKFNIRNIVPLCENDHRTGKDSAHEDRDKFMAWIKDYLPLHWKWYCEHKDESPRTLYAADWAEICDELKYYVNHPNEAEHLIYEKDTL